LTRLGLSTFDLGLAAEDLRMVLVAWMLRFSLAPSRSPCFLMYCQTFLVTSVRGMFAADDRREPHARVMVFLKAAFAEPATFSPGFFAAPSSRASSQRLLLRHG